VSGIFVILVEEVISSIKDMYLRHSPSLKSAVTQFWLLFCDILTVLRHKKGDNFRGYVDFELLMLYSTPNHRFLYPLIVLRRKKI